MYNSGYYSKTVNSLNVNNNVWRHLVWTISTDGTWKYYVDGVLLKTDANVVLPSRIARTNAWLGRTLWNDAPYNGLIDDFRIYDTALDANDVASLYQYTGGAGKLSLAPLF